MTNNSPFAAPERTTIPLEETFTLKHALRLRDALAAIVEKHGVIGTADAIAIAEALISEGLTNTAALRRAALAADLPEHCTDGSCDGPTAHDHGTDCGPLCICGKGE